MIRSTGIPPASTGDSVVMVSEAGVRIKDPFGNLWQIATHKLPDPS
jgi:uncharacterized glyoxalase superfamily protein PhnB